MAESPSIKSPPEEIADLHKENAAIIDEAVAADQADAFGIASHRLSGDRQAETWNKVFQVAVVANIDRRAGMNEIGNQEVGAQVLCSLERAVGGIRQQAVVLQDGAQRKRTRELIIPLAADDVVVERRVVCGAVEDAVKNVSIVDLQVSGGLEAHRVIDERFVACNRQLRRRNDNQYRAITNNLCAPSNQARRAAPDHETGDILDILVIVRQAGEINGAQDIRFHADNRCEKDVVPEVKNPVAAVHVLQTNAVVVPDVVRIEFGALKYQVFPLRPPVEMEVLGHIANVGSRNESRVRVEVGSNVLIQQFVGETPPKAIEHAFVVLTESVADGWRSNRSACTSRSIQRGNNRTGGVR